MILHGIRGIFLSMEAMTALDLLQIMDDEEIRPMHHGCNKLNKENEERPHDL